MKIADLFVKVGIDGAHGVQKGLKNINKGFLNVIGAIKKYALAAGVAAFAFSKIIKHSGQAAKELKVFEAITGASTKRLQQWQQVGAAFGVTNEEMASSLISVQRIFDKMFETGAAGPSSFAGIMTVLESIGGFDLGRAAKDPFYGMRRLQAFATANQRTTPTETEWLSQFIGSEKLIAAMQKGAFTDENLKKAITLDRGEIEQLAKVTAEWKRLGAMVTKVGAKVHALFGPPLIAVLKKLVEFVEILTDGFEAISTVIKGSAEAMSNLGKKWGIDVDRIHRENTNAQAVMQNSLVFTQNFSGDTDPKEVGKETKNAINRAFSNLQTRQQGN